MKNFRLILLILAGFFASISASQAAISVSVVLLPIPNAFHPLFVGNDVDGWVFQGKFTADKRDTKSAPYLLNAGSTYPVFKNVNGSDVQIGNVTVVDDGGGNGHLVFTAL